MTLKDRPRLGRGLKSLISTPVTVPPAVAANVSSPPHSTENGTESGERLAPDPRRLHRSQPPSAPCGHGPHGTPGARQLH